MIDTVVLTLGNDMFHISDPDAFKPSAKWVLSGASCDIRSKQNPTKKELAAGIYKPRLALAHRINTQGKSEITLKMEVSLPKLLFGNNLDELQQKDFAAIINKLVAILDQMGVVTTASALAQAPIFSIHYSKNIPLTDGSTPYHYINKIKEANVKLSLDVNQTDYRNEGHSYKWHCNSYEVVFYDKIKSLETEKKNNKRVTKTDSADLFDHLNAFRQKNKLEILRMEVRLNKRKKMKQLFTKLGIKSDLTFKNLFKLAIARKVLLHYVDELESKRPLLFDYKAKTDKDMLAELFFNNPGLTIKKVLLLYGFKKALEVVTPRELRGMSSKKLAAPGAARKSEEWYRLMADAQQIKLPTSRSPFGIIRTCIEKFKPVKLADFK